MKTINQPTPKEPVFAPGGFQRLVIFIITFSAAFAIFYSITNG